MSARRRIDIAERRARLGRRHNLALDARSATAHEVAGNLVALHGTDPATVYLAAASRMQTPDVLAIERALYDDRVLVRMLGMRRTMFVVPVELAPVVQAAATRGVAIQERRRTLQVFGEAGVADDLASWLATVEEAIVAALTRKGEATAQELAEEIPELRKQILLAEGKNYAGLQGVSTRILMQLSAEGRIIRGRPRGSWISSQYRWAPINSWLSEGLAELDTHVAQVELVARWLRAFGPGTLADLKWWTGWTTGEVRRALQGVETAEVDLEGAPGLVVADDLEPGPACEPWVALLPSLDPTPMGYAQRAWFLGSHAPSLFDRSGNIGPSIWCEGRVVGGWAQRKNGEIAVRLLEDVGAEASTAVASAAEQLSRWLGTVRVTPRFRTPLERELSA